jgi:hypothetical protein
MVSERWSKRWREFKMRSRVQALFSFRPITPGAQVSAFAKRPPVKLSEDGHVEDRPCQSAAGEVRLGAPIMLVPLTAPVPRHIL